MHVSQIYFDRRKRKRHTETRRRVEKQRIFTKKEKVHILNLLQMNLLSTHPGQQHTQNTSCHSLGSTGFQVNNSGLHVNHSVENQVLNAIHKFFWCFMAERRSLGSACQVYWWFSFPTQSLIWIFYFPSWLLKHQLLSPLLDCAWETQDTLENCSIL